MSAPLYAAVSVAEFPAQALLRLRTDLAGKPVAVLEGHPPLERVTATSRAARQCGVTPGMTRLEVEAVGGVHLLARSWEVEASTRAVLLECAAQFSPRIEDAGKDADCVYVLDISGTERLFGPSQQLAQRLRTALAEAGLRVSIAVSTNFHAARLKAAFTRGITIVPPGQEAQAMARLPMDTLALTDKQAATFALWGITTLGELADLPEIELITRLGQEARLWRSLALGLADHSFQPAEPVFVLREFCDFEDPIDSLDSLLFVVSRMVECLCTRASARALALASLTLHMELEGGSVYRHPIRPALPSVDRKFLFKLAQLELQAHPPQASVRVLRISAEPGHAGKVQLGLFAPQTPEPSRLDVTLARLRAIAGEDRVGAPVLENTHRPGAFRMGSFVVGQPAEARQPTACTALRRLRPARAVRVVLRGQQPAIFHDGRGSYVVREAFGPWRSSGCWWDLSDWDAEEWDVLATTQDGAMLACLLVLDHQKSTWRLEALYD